MKTRSFVIGSALLLLGGLNSVFAQHGGGGHTSGGHAGGGFSSGGSHASISHSGFTSAPRSRTLSANGIYHPVGAPVYGINRGALNNGYGRNGYGYGYRGGFYYLPPYFLNDYDYGYGYDSPYAYNQAPQDYSDQSSDASANMLSDQVAQLSAQVQSLQDQRNIPYAAAPGPYRPPYNAPPAMAEDETPSSPPLTLVMRDGKQMQLKNYAVMGRTIWDFSTQPAKRIPLANVDVAASRSATEASGAEFPEIQ
jgi:hypothetical protein